ncbi:MAG: General secretion pathway protein F [Olavius algarvensis Delta 4 endosymbiont]|nr:MAG: General secretion pathway protein F [Olavius algarvensis Delta 4 endosymbiont]
MPVFEYKVIDVKGKTRTGIIDAENAPAARQKLRLAKKFPVSVEEVQNMPSAGTPGRRPARSFFGRVKPAEIAATTRQLATLLGTGFQLVAALDLLIPQTKTAALKKALARIKEALGEGQSFARALEQFPGIFSPLYINMVRAGESSGTLEIILERLADISENQVALNERIKTTLAYPLFVSFFGVVVLIVLMLFVVPSITSIFADLDQVLPLPTRMLLFTSSLLTTYWWLLCLGVAGLFFILRAAGNTQQGKRYRDRALLQLPVIGILTRKLAMARFSRTLGSLLENGVAVLTALATVKNITGNVIISQAVQAAADEVEKGARLGKALVQAPVFPSLAIQMISVGEQSGNLEFMLAKIADIFEKEVEAQLLRAVALLEPVMIILIGSLVGFIVLSICLPIFEMSQLVN